MDKIEEIISLSDPGEVGRNTHNRGDRFSVLVSNVMAWIYPVLMLAIVSQIFLRGSGNNQAWLDDLQWWLYGAAVMVGIGYAVTTNSHVRVDIFFANFNANKQARIEVFGLAWLFLPFIILAWDMTFHYAVASVQANEGSDSPNGLHRLYLLKVFLNISLAFVGIAVWAAYVRYLSKLTRPLLWRQLLYALPSTMFLVNLIIFYILYWYVRLTAPPDFNIRRVTREPIFEPVELMGVETPKTMVMTFVVTAIVILLAYLMRSKDERSA
ncbi:MAG: TRAP transporter small permease subunit [Pseudomonadota bacterium]